MAANGRGSMRPQGRSPPFLVIGLLVALVILGANYWSLSSSNSALAFEVAELQDQVRQLSAKRISAEKKIDSLAESYNRNKDSLEQKESDVQSLSKQITDKANEVIKVAQEKENCQNNLNNCEENSNGIQQELQKVKEELEQAKKKEEEKEANTPDCDSVCGEMKKMIFSVVEKTLGINAVLALQQAGVDVGEYKEKLAALQQQPQPRGDQTVQQQPQQQVDTAVHGQSLVQQGDGNIVVNQPGESNPQTGQGQNLNPQAQANINPQQGQEQAAPGNEAPQQGQNQPNPNLNPQDQGHELNVESNPALNQAAAQQGDRPVGDLIPPGQNNPDQPNLPNHQVPPPNNQQGGGLPQEAMPDQSLHSVTRTEHTTTDPSFTSTNISQMTNTPWMSTNDTYLSVAAGNENDHPVDGDDQDEYEDEADEEDDKLKYVANNNGREVQAADDSIDSLGKNMKFQEQQK